MLAINVKRKLFVLRLIVLVILVVGLIGSPQVKTASATPAQQGSIVFSDDFSTDPNTNGKWRFSRGHPTEAYGEGFWDSTNQFLFLTGQAEYSAVAMLANYALTSKTWEAEFNYWVGAG